MIDWNSVTYDDIILLATIAASHGMGISDMLHNLNTLSTWEREAVNEILSTAQDDSQEVRAS